MKTNFTACALLVPLNETLINLYGYSGPVRGLAPDRSSQITRKGCDALCGTGIDWYPWKESSKTVGHIEDDSEDES